MTMRFGSIIIHKPDPNSDGNHSSSSDEAEIAEIAETAIISRYSRTKREGHRRRSERQRRMMAKDKLRHSSSSSISSSELPILKGISQSDKSPPLNRSHLALDERLESDSSPVNQRRGSVSSASSQAENSSILGFRVLISGSRTDLQEQRRSSSTISDVKNNTINHVSIRENSDDEGSLSGLTKLLRNLNFAEKIRQQKAEQERLNINKLPTHMREQLKNLYVY